MAQIVNNWKELRIFVEDALRAGVSSLPQKHQVIVENPRSVEKYQLNHVKGSLLVVGKGAEYRGENGKPSNIEQNIIQDKDYQFAVVCVIRKLDDGMEPEEYLDFAEQTISGLELEVRRWWRKIYPVESEFLKEENGIWWYMITFAAPMLFAEKEIVESGE